MKQKRQLSVALAKCSSKAENTAPYIFDRVKTTMAGVTSKNNHQCPVSVFLFFTRGLSQYRESIHWYKKIFFFFSFSTILMAFPKVLEEKLERACNQRLHSDI